jgi:hypothetical protein
MSLKQKAGALKRAAERAAALRREATPGAMARTPAMPGEGQVRAEIGGMWEDEAARAKAAQRLDPLGEEAAYLLPAEAAKAAGRADNVVTMERMLDFLPKAKELSAVMKAGGAKRGWYRASAQALIDTFGDDAPRFASLLAAMSPQTSVENNLTNALNTWKNWTAAGRPTDERSIMSIMGRSVMGNKGEKSVLDAWVNNSMRALQAEDPSKVVLSGPKVDSFMGNLADDVYRVTNDAWNANLLGVSQGVFSGSMTDKNPLDPGLTPGYLATNARMRKAADLAGMSPAEGQETAWSFAMQLYEKARKTGRSVTDLLESGEATDELIRGAPDFSTLFTQPAYRTILEEAGYGPQVAGMAQHPWPDLGGNIMDRLDPEERKLVLQSAKRLDALADQRKREGFAASFWKGGEQPDRLPLFGTFETTPYAESGHLTGVGDLSEKSKANLTSKLASAFRNPAERDVLHEALGLPGIETRTATGAWMPESGIAETNPAFAAGVELPLTRSGELRQADRRKLEAAEAARGYMTAQGGSAFSGMNPGGTGGYYIPREGKAPADIMGELAGDPRMKGVALADTGGGINVFNPEGAVSDEALAALRQRFATPGTAEGAEYTRLPTIAPASPVGGYIDYESAWKAPPGSGAVAREMFNALDALPASQRSALGEAMLQPAGDLYEQYRRTQKGQGLPVREDLMNALDILRRPGPEGGLEGLRKALERGDFIAGLAPMMLPGMALMPGYGQEQTV